MDYLVSLLSTPLYFLILIMIVVFLHELGHFLAARAFGVRVEVFSIGFGKEIWGFDDRHGTRWKLAMIPLGGYVQMYGDADPASSTDYSLIKKLSKAQKRVAFYFKPLYQKAIIVFAGPFANYLTALVILTVMFAAVGKLEASSEVTHVQADSVAESAGFKVGDVIIAIDGNEVSSFEEIRGIIALSLGKELAFEVKRGEQILDLKAAAKLTKMKDPFGDEIEMPVLGIATGMVHNRDMNLIEAVPEAFATSISMCKMILVGTWQLITGERDVMKELGGPIRIAEYSAKSAQGGVWSFLGFIAMISLNLALINLLPIPMLDGGHLTFYAIEAIIRRPIPPFIVQTLLKIGFALLVSLIIFVTINDIWRLLS